MLLLLLAGSILYFITVSWLGAGLVIDWQTHAGLESVQVPLFNWSHPLLDIELETSSYVVRQTFWGSELRVNLWPAYVLLVAAVIGISVALAVISSLRRFWYTIGIALFCVLVVSLRLEQIMLFERIDKTTDIIIFVLFLPLSYYFQAIRPAVELPMRALAFGLLFVLISLLIYFFASVSVPFLYIANYGLPVWLLLSFLLIILVSPEIIAAILYLVTASNTESSRNSLTHFVLASLIYLGNLFLYFLENRGVFDFGLYYISPFWILLLSMVISIWTLRSRSENFAGILPYQPQGLLLYLALGIISLATISYVFATANDPLIDAFEDAILYTHMGMGFLFFLYIIANFVGLLHENKKVFRVVYKPRSMPLFTARLAGVIAIFGFYSLHGMFAIYKPMGGYYNGIGDLYTAENNLFLAEQYYKLGSQHRFANHRSNYALASLAGRANKPVQAMLFLKDGIERHPTPYAYANLSNLYFDNNLYFDGLFTLREGIERFPNEGRLYNNLGVQFGRTNVLDSALYYLDVAARDKSSREAAVANELALLVHGRAAVPIDSLHNFFEEGDLFYQNNLLTLYNRLGAAERAPERANPRALQELGGIETAWLLNYALLRQDPDSLLPRQLKQLIDSTPVSYYEEPAILALAVLQYKQQNHFAAFEHVDELVQGSAAHAALYSRLLGSWALEQAAPALAARFFQQAQSQGSLEAGNSLAIALAEAGRPAEAAGVLISMPDSLLSQAMQRKKADALLYLGTQDFSAYPGNRNEAAYKALRWQWGSLNREEERALLVQIQDRDWRNRAVLWLAETKLRRGALAEAEAYLQQLRQPRSAGTNDALLRKEQQLRHRLALLQHGRPAENQPAVFEGPLGQLYAAGSQAQLAGDTATALRSYRQIMQASPFMEEAYLAAVPLLNQQGAENEAYDFLLNGIRFNPFAVELRKAYILQGLRLGLEQYAEDELQKLQEQLETEHFERFLQLYRQLRNDQSYRQSGW